MLKRTSSYLYGCAQRQNHRQIHLNNKGYYRCYSKAIQNPSSSTTSSSWHSYSTTAWGTFFADDDYTFSDTSSRSSSSKIIVQQVHDLLLKSHAPRVVVQPSQIAGAGNGVFYVNTDNNNDGGSTSYNEQHEQQEDQPTVLCLYPGIYTPGLPSHIDVESSIYLATNNEERTGAVTPSGVPFQDNAYILNVPVPYNGYIDGNNTTTIMNPSSSSSSLVGEGTVLSKFCGHYINHAPTTRNSSDYSRRRRSSSSSIGAAAANVRVVGFQWNDVIQLIQGNLDRHNDDDQQDDKTTTTLFEDSIQTNYHRIPNSIRNDGTPWYYDPYQQRIIYFPSSTSTSSSAAVVAASADCNHNNSTTTAKTAISYDEQINNCNNCSSSPSSHNDNASIPFIGAAIVADQPSSNIGHGGELYLDYGLREPYPRWASSWYVQ